MDSLYDFEWERTLDVPIGTRNAHDATDLQNLNGDFFDFEKEYWIYLVMRFLIFIYGNEDCEKFAAGEYAKNNIPCIRIIWWS